MSKNDSWRPKQPSENLSPEVGGASDQENFDGLKQRNAELEGRWLEAEHALSKFRADLTPLKNELESTKERLEFFETLLAPRLKSVLTLKPLRYVIAERNRKKRAEQEIDPIEPALHQPRADADTAIERSRNPTAYDDYEIRKPIGVALFAHDRANDLRQVLESLTLQSAIKDTTVFIDGDQGRPLKRAAVDEVERVAREFAIPRIRRNYGNLGFRKMMVITMREMMSQYERILFLEDDCFPTSAAIKGFSFELDQIDDDPSIFSVYGHPFLVEGEGEQFTRFQGWGWATTAEKLRPIWERLLNCYLMSEAEYLDFVQKSLTPDIRSRIDVTPGRQPTSTLEKFFAWDETVCLLTAMEGMTHRRSKERIIYNFGAGEGSTHFHGTDWFRRPPFNMIERDEVWRHF